MFDIIIKNGTIIDGTGRERYRADVGIKNGEIKKIGELHDERSEMEIDASDKFVCPGFIDVNNHSDSFWQIFLNPNLESLLYQGITTIIGGNCGSSLAPLVSARNIDTIQKWADIKQVNLNWLSLKEFLKTIEKKPLSVNFGTLVGHGTMRRGILGDQVRSLVYKELDFIKKSLTKSLFEGAFGVSTGLIYTHARLASTEELIDLARVVKKHQGVYTSHIRGEKEDLIEAVEEAIEVGRQTGVNLHISHLKAMGKKNWPKMDEAISLIEQAKNQGVNITFDVYPYTNTGSVLYALLPGWVSEGGKKIMIHRLKDPAIRSKVITEMKRSGFDYSKVEIAISPLNKTLARRKIVEVAASQNKSIEDAVIDILIASEGRVITSMEILSEDNIRKAIKHPLSIIATNGSGYNLSHASSGEIVHPRSFGSMIKVLTKYVREENLISWEEAINKMTGLPAEKFSISKRGKIKEKIMADIIVFDPHKLSSPASKDNPYQYSQGIDFMLINGKLTIREGEYTGEKQGKVIKK